ncbi:MAG TPA: efflux RND transporter periplasmic adaptor subunit [Terriglobales bacterium]|jgi:multidrug efflux pump subunit AcrA (membrane-fusion protein)|nr:efflux RND transporter periplasmic adaptor subunit [Terriglobales bacterium]
MTARNQQPRKQTRRAVAAGLAALLALLSFGCSGKEKEKEPVVSVESALVQRTRLQRTVTTEAIVSPLHQAALVPKISAPVKKFYINRGSHVRQGQLLAVLENKDLSAAAEQSKGEFEQAQAAYETTTVASVPEEVRKAELDAQAAKQNLEAEQKVYAARQDLYKQGALPRKELDAEAVTLTQARNNYEIAQQHLNSLLKTSKAQELRSAQGQLAAAKGKYQGAAAQLSYSEIRSPISGVVTDRPLYPGEMATAGTPLLTVMDLSHVIAKAHIPQAEAALLKVGDTATVSAPGLEDPIPGKVSVVSPALDPNSTTVEVWVDARNPHQELKPGTSVSLSMLAQTIPDALTVPAAAVLTEPDGTTSVMVIGDDSRAHQRDVKTGVRQENQIQIVSGLKAGERVVTAGAYGLPDNTRVQLQAPPSQPVKESKE